VPGTSAGPSGKFFEPASTSGYAEETNVLCELNVSSTFAFPGLAMPAVAKAAIERIQEARA
jgi:hypothetical protein